MIKNVLQAIGKLLLQHGFLKMYYYVDLTLKRTILFMLFDFYFKLVRSNFKSEFYFTAFWIDVM